MTRFQRQQAEVLGTLGAGDVRRALTLSREHLAEFPEDRLVRRAMIDSVELSGDRSLRDELRDLLAAIGGV